MLFILIFNRTVNLYNIQMVKFLKSFKRITSSGNYIAEIDGLRFLAIFSVILFHCKGAFIILHDKNPIKFPQDLHRSLVYPFLDCGNQGVELFFAISGFILALPFITQFRYKGKELTIRKFYFRRLTRLEPPYILALLLLFVLKMLGKEYPFHVLFPSLLASMVYLHNIIYPGLPKITGLIWSLEVEVQFYLLTPFLLRIFLLPKNVTRIILVAATLLMPLLQNLITTDTNSLFKFFQFFTVGILLADLYLDKTSFIHNLKGVAVAMLGIVFLFLLFWVKTYDTATSSTSVFNTLQLVQKVSYPFLILIFYIIVIGNPIWKRIFSTTLLTVIGGMCYSIYLLHAAVISIFEKYIFRIKITNNALIEFAVSTILFLIPILIIASIFFKLIEQPCMERDWYKRLFKRLQGKT